MLGSPISADRSLCILHVDDHVLNRRLVGDILDAYGHDAIEARSGDEAIHLIAERIFDVILLDINMPGMNGIEVVRRLRSSAAPGRDTPVIALTSEVSRTRADYRALGFDDFVAKPFSVAALICTINDCARLIRPRENLAGAERRALWL